MSDWFRRFYEAPEESGDGTVIEEPEGDSFVSAFNDPARWDAPPATDGGEAESAPSEEPPANEEPAQPAATKPEGWSDEDWAGFQKQFPGGSPADLYKHYTELRTRFSRGEHLQPQAEPEPEPEPEAPPSWMSHQFTSLGEIPSNGRLSPQQATELRDLMELSPESAANWAAANSHLLTEEEFRAVQNVWYQADPYAATQAWEEARLQRERDAQAEQYGPARDVTDDILRREGVRLAAETLPVFEANREQFKDWLLENPTIDEHLATFTEPETIRNAVISAFYQWYGPYRLSLDAQEQQAEAERVAAAEAEAAAVEQAAEAANRRARTATTSARATPNGAGASPDDIRAAIRAAR